MNKEHVHLLSFPPKYSISAVLGLLKAVSAKEIREECPEVRKHLWGAEFWEDGYFVRTVGDKVTADVIKKYIRFHEAKKRGDEQLDLFQKAPPGRSGSLPPPYYRGGKGSELRS